MIFVKGGKTRLIANSLLKRKEVIYLERSIGQHNIDVRVETILEGNAQILRTMELLKRMPGIKHGVWTEIVEVIGTKTSIPIQIIDKL